MAWASCGTATAFSMDTGKRILDAKQKAIALAANYRPVEAACRPEGAGKKHCRHDQVTALEHEDGRIHVTEFEELLAGTIADVITGGDVPAGTLITEEYLLELEREAFLKLCGQKKTLERIQYMLKKGKALRN